MKLTCLIIVCVTLSLASHVARADGFVHPGVLHSKEDLERMKAKVSAKAQPWLGGFDALASSKYASAGYRLRGPVTNCTFGGGKGQYEIRDDSSAAYCNALMWYITGEKSHLEKAKQIINAWSATMQTFDRKDNLSAGMSAQKFAAAGEILRYTKGADWSEADILACEKMFRELLHPAIVPTRAGNQGALCLTGASSATTVKSLITHWRRIWVTTGRQIPAAGPYRCAVMFLIMDSPARPIATSPMRRAGSLTLPRSVRRRRFRE